MPKQFLLGGQWSLARGLDGAVVDFGHCHAIGELPLDSVRFSRFPFGKGLRNGWNLSSFLLGPALFRTQRTTWLPHFAHIASRGSRFQWALRLCFFGHVRRTGRCPWPTGYLGSSLAIGTRWVVRMGWPDGVHQWLRPVAQLHRHSVVVSGICCWCHSGLCPDVRLVSQFP